MRKNTTIEHFQKFAEEYDKKSEECGWNSPQIMFGLAFEQMRPNQKLLDIGIGTGKSSERFYRYGLEIFGIDASREMLKICQSKKIAKELNLVDLKNGKIPYPNEKFDHVISCGVFYFFKNLKPFFKETYRLLKTNGTFSFTTEDNDRGEINSYMNRDNNIVSERLNRGAGVKMFTHPARYITSLSGDTGFELIGQIKYLAYHSPTENRDVWFRNYCLRKIKHLST